MKKLLSFLLGVCLAVSTIAASVGLTVFQKGFYTDIYEKIDLAKRENITKADLENSIFMMIDYVQGTRDDLNGTVAWKGKQQETFNEKEKAHMVDVKRLWQNTNLVMWICLGAAALLGVYFFVTAREHWLSWLARGIVQAWLALAVVLAVLGIWMYVDFTGLWIQFHHVFFTNDLWSLDPATDFMIIICPEELFSSLILRICTVFGGISIVLVGFSVYWLNRKTVIGYDRAN